MAINKAGENCAVCPFLGIECDPETHYLVPDAVNLCHQARPPWALNLKYQEDFCLTTHYDRCDGFLAGWGKGLPDAVFQKIEQRKGGGLWGWARAILVGLGIIGLGIWVIAALPFTNPAGLPGLTHTPTPTALSSPTLIASPLPERTATTTPARTQTPLPTLTLIPSQTPGPFIETPMGLRNQCLVHLVVEGDSLTNLSERFNTSVSVLAAINGERISPLWLGAYTVICPEQLNPAGLPQLNPQFLAERTRVEDLAAETGVNSADLMEWNGIDGEWIEAGRWVLLPQP